jgi:hypothetical protein
LREGERREKHPKKCFTLQYLCGPAFNVYPETKHTHHPPAAMIMPEAGMCGDGVENTFPLLAMQEYIRFGKSIKWKIIF